MTQKCHDTVRSLHGSRLLAPIALDIRQAKPWWSPVRLRNRLVLGAFVDNAGMSEREVARRAGLSHSTVNHLITGRRTTCTLSTAAAIARTVGCPIGALFMAETATEQRSIDQIRCAELRADVTCSDADS